MAGSQACIFPLDDRIDGLPEGTWMDSVKVTVVSGADSIVGAWGITEEAPAAPGSRFNPRRSDGRNQTAFCPPVGVSAQGLQ